MNYSDVNIGDKFWRLCVVGFGPPSKWNFVCDCGSKVTASIHDVIKGSTKSCGCWRRYRMAQRNKQNATQHGLSASKIGRAWRSMIFRCYNNKCENYGLYGGIGIRVCEYLRASISNLLEIIGHAPPSPPMWSIDRIDNMGHYSCGKCSECVEKGWTENIRWATSKTQNRNRKSNRMVTINGVTKCAVEWAEQIGVPQKAFRLRLKHGWSGEKLLRPLRIDARHRRCH